MKPEDKIDNETFMKFLNDALKPQKLTFWQATRVPLVAFLSSPISWAVRSAFLWLAFFLVNQSWSFVPALSFWSAAGLILIGNFIRTVVHEKGK